MNEVYDTSKRPTPLGDIFAQLAEGTASPEDTALVDRLICYPSGALDYMADICEAISSLNRNPTEADFCAYLEAHPPTPEVRAMLREYYRSRHEG